MKKISTAKIKNQAAKKKVTIGMDLGDRSSRYCLLDEEGVVIGEESQSAEPWIFFPAQFPQFSREYDLRELFVCNGNGKRCDHGVVFTWGAEGPGFKSRQPDQ